jgi:hypothetical protein
MVQDSDTSRDKTTFPISKPADQQISELAVEQIPEPKVDHENQVLAETPDNVYMGGWRLHFLTAGIWLALFLSTLETAIISTSLVSITDAVGGFEMRDCKFEPCFFYENISLCVLSRPQQRRITPTE